MPTLVSKCTKIVQISDMHLFSDEAKTLAGLNTAASLDATLSQLQAASYHQADAIILTGDLIQDDLPSSYQLLAAKLQPIKLPIYWLPGNHDIPSIYTGDFVNHNIHADKLIDFPSWRLVLLNSTQWGKVPGLLNAEQKAFMQYAIRLTPAKHLMIGIHHPPTTLENSWLNAVGLINAAEFWQIIRDEHHTLGANIVKCVIAGHIHQDLTEHKEGVQLLATPSTCIQFKPNTPKFALDKIPPGYRYLELHADGTVITKVYRVENFAVNFDPNIKGY